MCCFSLFNSLGQGIDNWGSVPSFKQNATRLIVSWNSGVREDRPSVSQLDNDYSDFPFRVKLPNLERLTTKSSLDDDNSKPPTRIILATKPNRISGWLNDPYLFSGPTTPQDFSASMSTTTEVSANPSPTMQVITVTSQGPSEGPSLSFDTTPSTMTATVQSGPIKIGLPKEIESPSRQDHITTTLAPIKTPSPFEINSTSDTSDIFKVTTTNQPSGSPKPDFTPAPAFQAEANKNITDTIIAQLQKDIYQFNSTTFYNSSKISFLDPPSNVSNHTDDFSEKLPSKITLNLANSSSKSNKTTNYHSNNTIYNYGSSNSGNAHNSINPDTARFTTKLPRSTTRVSSTTTTTRVPLNPVKVKGPNSTLSSKRPSTKANTVSLSDEFLGQFHQIATQKPYIAKRDCGVRSMTKREGRVVGGRDSHLGEFPWSVLIRETTLLGFFVKTKCGGVLIDLKWVLTAAHCQPGMFGSLVVVVGEYDLQGKSSRLKPIIRKVKRMIIHRDYNPSNFDNDIALLELESPYQIQPHVVPICLPEKDEEFIGQLAMVAGWGKLSFGGPVPTILQVAKLPVIGNKQCQEMYHNSGHMKIISDSFLCAGYENGGQDSCEGDSGGPLQVQRNDSKWVLVGTVSHGIKCAEPNLPGIYIKTAAYLPWIKAVTYHQDNNKRYGHRRGFSRLSETQKL